MICARCGAEAAVRAGDAAGRRAALCHDCGALWLREVVGRWGSSLADFADAAAVTAAAAPPAPKIETAAQRERREAREAERRARIANEIVPFLRQHGEGATLDEIAAATGTPSSTTKTLVTLAVADGTLVRHGKSPRRVWLPDALAAAQAAEEAKREAAGLLVAHQRIRAAERRKIERTAKLIAYLRQRGGRATATEAAAIVGVNRNIINDLAAASDEIEARPGLGLVLSASDA